VAKFKNVSGEDLTVGPLGNRLVLDGQVVEVSEELETAYVWGAPFWEPVKEPKAKAAAGSDDESQEG
jgi:hypothetical protein